MRHTEEDPRLEVLARNVANRLKEATDSNENLLFDFSEGKSFAELAEEYTSGNEVMLRRRLDHLFGDQFLKLPLLPSSKEARELLSRAFDILDEQESKSH